MSHQCHTRTRRNARRICCRHQIPAANFQSVVKDHQRYACVLGRTIAFSRVVPTVWIVAGGCAAVAVIPRADLLVTRYDVERTQVHSII